jgi:hemerythrin
MALPRKKMQQHTLYSLASSNRQLLTSALIINPESSLMKLIPWMQEYNTGIVMIDAQHKRLVDIINKLHNAIQAGSDQETLVGILSKLTDYTKYHFDFEEGLLEKLSYTGLENHKEEHQEFIHLVEGMAGRLNNEKLNTGNMLLKYLRSWLSNHILIEDMKALSLKS